MIADVPVGVLLSGGVDSSLIVGLLAEAGQSGLKTFSIGFEAVHGEKGDEFQYSDLIAKHFGTDHHKLMIDSKRMLGALPDAIVAMSEPMVSHDNVGFYLLSEAVSKHVKVVQSGQGADEVFGGYHWYPPMADTNDEVGDYRRAFFDRDLATEHPQRVDHDLNFNVGVLGKERGVVFLDCIAARDRASGIVDVFTILGPQPCNGFGVVLVESSDESFRPSPNQADVGCRWIGLRGRLRIRRSTCRVLGNAQR
jgi:asparagine synthetase B (glutamine-hydrolysing)